MAQRGVEPGGELVRQLSEVIAYGESPCARPRIRCPRQTKFRLIGATAEQIVFYVPALAIEIEANDQEYDKVGNEGYQNWHRHAVFSVKFFMRKYLIRGLIGFQSFSIVFSTDFFRLVPKVTVSYAT